MKSVLSASTLALVLVAIPAAAGVVYEIEVKDHEQSPPTTQDMSVSAEGKNIAMDVLPGEGGRGEGEMIFRGDRREMVVVDDDEQSYYVVDKDALAGIAGQVSGAMAQVEQMLKNLPKEQQDAIRRAQEEAMRRGGSMPGMPGAERVRSEMRKTGERGDKNGYPCVKYEVFRGDRKVRELWVTDWSNVEGGSEVVGAFEDMADFFQELMDSIPDFGQGGGPDMDFTQTFGEGFPVVTSEFDPDTGDLEGETSLRSARRRTLDPDAFEPPSGYKLRQMFSP